MVHATSAAIALEGWCCQTRRLSASQYWTHSITFADSVARVREATRGRKQVDSTNSIVLPETVTTLAELGGSDGTLTRDLLRDRHAF